MKKLKTLLVLVLFLFTSQAFGQKAPDHFQTMFDDIVKNFETITSGNSIKQGKSTLSLVKALVLKHPTLLMKLKPLLKLREKEKTTLEG